MKQTDTKTAVPPHEPCNNVIMMETDCDDIQFAARRRELLARFGDKAGKHGPRAAQKIAIMLRVPKLTDARAEILAHALGLRKSQLVLQAVNVFTACKPARWYAAITAFQRASGGALKLPDWFELDDSEGSDYEALDESDSADPAPAARRVRD